MNHFYKSIRTIIPVILIAALPLQSFAAVKKTPPTASLQSSMDAIIKKVSNHANIGVIVQTIDGRQTLYQHNANDLFIPASVNKLFVAIAALDYLKPSYQFETRLRTTGQVNQGILNGDLYVQFNGDPTLTEKELINLLNELKTLGINQINGSVFLDNTSYGSAAYAPGWLLNDLIFGYAAPLNAVIINENRFNIILSPAKNNGNPAQVSSTVPDGVIKVENNTITSSNKQNCYVSIYSESDNTYHLTGCLTREPDKQYYALALRDPVAYAKALIANTLTKNGISFNGPVAIQQTPSNATVLGLHQSIPLDLIVKEMLKDSDNLYTNSILKQLGGVFYQTQGTWENGLNAIKQILTGPAGINFSKIHLFDGSGLSRYDLVSPQELMKLLYYAYNNPQIQPYIWDALPIAGQDGTLKGRLINFAEGGVVHAKTGTMKNSGVSALAGYMKTRRHGLIIFVIMTNSFEDTHRNYKYTEDEICQLLLSTT